MAAAKLMENTKMEVRAMLESSPFAVTVREAPRDYRDQVGYDLPFRQLGFASAEELFRSMPDTVVIQPSPKGPILKCVANESTKHVERMVRTQKKTQGKVFQLFKEPPVPPAGKNEPVKKALLPMPPMHQTSRGHQAPSSGRPPPAMSSRQPPPLITYPYVYAPTPVNFFPRHRGYSPMYAPYMQRNMYPYPQYQCSTGSLPAFGPDSRPCPVPEHVKRDVRQLLQNNASGLSVEVFRLLFQETFKYPITLEHLGYPSIYDVISAIPEVAGLKNAGNYLQIVPSKLMPVTNRDHPTAVPTSKAAKEESTLTGEGTELCKSECAATPADHAVPTLPDTAALHAALGLTVPNIPNQMKTCEKTSDTLLNGPTDSKVLKTNENQFSSTHSLAAHENCSSYKDEMAHDPQLSTQAISRNLSAIPDLSTKTFTWASWECSGQNSELEPSFQAESSIRSPFTALPAECPKRSKEKKKSGNSASNSINDKMKDTFLKILEANPNGIWHSELMSKYQKITGCRLDYRELGFYSIMELVVAIPDIFSIKRSKKTGECLLLPSHRKLEDTPDSGMESLSHSSSPKEKSKKKNLRSPSINLQLKRKLMEVICSCPSGVVLSEFENIYQVFHNEPLNLDSLKHYTAEALFLALSDIIVLDYVDDKTILVKATVAGKKLLDTPVSKPEKFRVKSLPSTLAEDAILNPTPFKWQALPKLQPGKRYIEVYVTYLVTPSNFWVQLRGMDTSVALDELMNSMRQVYYHPVISQRYELPEEFSVAFGFYCAALYPADQNWHRAMVTGTNSEGAVTVLYVDFGNETTVPRSAIRLLKREYVKLPAQAIHAKLANIIPVRGPLNEWSPAAVQRFKELCLNSPLVASVVDVEAKQLSLSLYDTSGENDVRINDTLVSENHATLAIFQPLVTQANQLLGRTTDPRTELRNSIGSCNSVKDLELGMSVSHGRPSLPSSNSDAEELPATRADVLKSKHLEELTEELNKLQMEKDPYHVNEAELVGRTFHVVRLDGTDYIPTFEISELFWKSDILRRMVTLTPLSVNFCVIEKASRPILHRDISRLRKNGNSNDANIALCPLKRIPDILPLFIRGDDELLQAFADLVKLRGA